MSTHFGSNHFHWEENELYLGKKTTGVSVEFHHNHALPGTKEDEVSWYNMYKIRFADDKLSEDYYNLTRAKDNAKKLEMRRLNMVEEEDI